MKNETAEHILLNFDKSKENIPRQITSIVPTRNIHPETGRSRIAEDVKNGTRKPYSINNAFELEGVKGLIKHEADALLVAGSLARYKYSVNNAFISDIGAGIYTMITTQGKGLYDFREIITRDLNRKEDRVGARVIISLETLYKAAFGALVNHNGRAIHGAGDIVEAAKDKIMPIIDGKVPMPRAYASIQKHDPKTGESIVAVIEGEPIRVYRKSSGAKDALIIDLDYFFFPAIEKGTALQASDLYIHQVAGLTSFLQLGAKIHRAGKKAGSIDVTTARKIILAAQAAYELRYFAPDIVKENKSGRINISLRRGAVGDLYPSAIDNQGYIRYKQFSEAVALSGQYFHHAMKALGIFGNLVEKGEVLIPAIEQGAEFPKEYPQIVFIKADKAA
ncbi:MAG: hypothetical protein KA369_03670 [Spirochaetes bacterium]|nr:hypothetical protein [Spirochaetota bacterium]